MGMYLGVSFVAMYDLAEVIVISVYKFVKKQRPKKKKSKLKSTRIFKRRISDCGDNHGFQRRTIVYSY